MRKRTLSREFALQVLYQHEMNDEALEELLLGFWELNREADDEMREYTERIVKGTLENTTLLDSIIDHYADNWNLERMALLDKNILRYAVYELLFCEDIPPKVTINEAVNIAKKFSQPDSGKFVNGILDKINHADIDPSKWEVKSSS